MIDREELQGIAIFDCLSPEILESLTRECAELRVAADEYLVREGEQPYFCVVLQGAVQVRKIVNGREVRGFVYERGAYLGEVPMLLGTPAFASVQAVEPSRLMCMDLQQLRSMIDSSEQCSALILQTMAKRLSMIQERVLEVPATRVLLVGESYDTDVREIREFLSMNRIPYEWVDRERQPDRVPTCMLGAAPGPSVVIDQSECLGEQPTVRMVAEKLGYRVSPRESHYDVVVIGGGPAGLAASVYGASEGLQTLMVERHAVGGQAGTSSRIENYLGFAGGISGNELAARALQQANKFDADMVVTRQVVNLAAIDGGYCVELDGGTRVTTRAVVLATGVDWRRLQAEGIERLQGRGVLYGAGRTEAASVVGKDIFIVGGGNSAGQAAMFFSSYARSVTMLVRGEKLELSMSQYLISQIAAKCNIAVEPYTTVVRVNGEDQLTSVTTVTDGSEPETRDADALFIMIGADAETGWLPAELQRDERGYVCTGRDVSDMPGWQGKRPPFLLETSMPGVFCAGDVRHDSVKRVASGVGEGSMAIAFVHQYLAMEDRQRQTALAAD